MRKKTLCLVLATLLLVLGLGCQKKAKAVADGTYTVAVTLAGGSDNTTVVVIDLG